MSLVSNVSDLATRIATELKRKANSYPTGYDLTAGRADGSLGVTSSGHTWFATGTGGSLPAYSNGGISFPTGTGATVSSTYSLMPMPSTPVWISGELRFAASNTVGASAAIGAFSGTVPANSDSPAHFSITPTYCQFSVFRGGVGDYTSLTPIGYLDTAPRFPKPLTCDGVTTYPVEIAIDPVRGMAWCAVADFPVLVYQDERISMTALYPFWQSFGVSGMTNNATWLNPSTELSFRNSSPLVTRYRELTRHGQIPMAGAGTIYNRPISRMRPGGTWWDTTNSKLTISTGNDWRDTANAIVGNLFDNNVASAADGPVGMVGAAGTLTQVRPGNSKFRTSRVHQLVSTGASTQTYTTSYPPATVGTVYTASVGQALMSSAAAGRSAYLQIRFYNASNVQQGTSTTGSTVTVPNTGDPVAIPAVTATAPTGTTKAMVVLLTSGVVTGEVLQFTEISLATGTLTGSIQP